MKNISQFINFNEQHILNRDISPKFYTYIRWYFSAVQLNGRTDGWMTRWWMWMPRADGWLVGRRMYRYPYIRNECSGMSAHTDTDSDTDTFRDTDRHGFVHFWQRSGVAPRMPPISGWWTISARVLRFWGGSGWRRGSGGISLRVSVWAGLNHSPLINTSTDVSTPSNGPRKRNKFRSNHLGTVQTDPEKLLL